VPGRVDGVQPEKLVSVSAGAEKPVVVTVKVPGLPAANVVLLVLVMDGAWLAWLVAPENWESGALTQSVLRS
jgi:hypothetical protein